MNARNPLILCLLSSSLVLAACGTSTPPPAAPAPTSTAASFPTTPPPPGPAPTLHIPTPQSSTLANGLRIVTAQRDGLPLVTARLIVRGGSETDPANQAGLAALTATLLTRGAGKLDAPQQAAAAEALGGSLSSGAGWDDSSVGMTVTSNHLPAALKLIATAVREPTFAKAEVARARKQTADGLRLMRARPTSMASLLAAREIFGNGAYGHSSDGSLASLKRIDRADIARQHATWYRPDNAILVLAGDIDMASARQLAESAFGDWKAPDQALPARGPGVGKSTGPAVLVVDQKGGGQAGVVATHQAINRTDADYYIGTVANAVLGGSYSARLNEEIRIKRGLSYGAHSNLDARRDGGQWQATVQTKNPSAAQVVALILTEFDKLRTTPVPAAELAARKATLSGSYGRSLETTSGLASRVGGLALYDIDLGQISQFIDHVEAVTPAQIQAFAKAHLGKDGVHVVVVGDAAQFAAKLKQAHPDLKQVDIEKINLDAH